MPAKSKSQQRFFGMVDAYKKGELKHASKSIKDAAESMSSKEVKKFAKTKHKGLPEKVKHKKKLNEGYNSYAEALQDIIDNCQTSVVDMLQNPRNGDLKDTARNLARDFGMDENIVRQDIINGLLGKERQRKEAEENTNNIHMTESQFNNLVCEMVKQVLKNL